MNRSQRAAHPNSLWELLNLGQSAESAWMVNGLCAQTDPEAFFPVTGVSPAAAKKVCRRCPVQAACLAWALDHHETDGVWGGMSPVDRRKLRRSRAGGEAA